MLLHRVLLEYADGDKMAAFRNAMQASGMVEIGYGANALVMRARDGGVVKIFEPDPCYLAFLKLVRASQDNPHFPRVRTLTRFKKGKFRGNYLLKMEALEPLPKAEYAAATGFHCFVAQTITRNPFSLNLSYAHTRDHAKAGSDPVETARTWAEQNTEFAKAIQAVAQGMKSGCGDDLHRENLMKRGDTWVIIDPYTEA